MKNYLLIATLSCLISMGATCVEAQTNLALGKRATQSIDADPVNGLAFKAVDGNTDGNWASGSVTHTVDGGSNNPWWQVDLGGVYMVNSVLVWNRTDCCAERFNNAKVLIRSSENEPWQWFSPENQLYTYNGQNPIRFRNRINGRYVRIQLEGPKAILSLAEVIVYGSEVQSAVPAAPVINANIDDGSLGTNIALGKTAMQSSNADPVNGQASRAVDGNTDGNWAHGSVTHTVDGGSNFPWWQVDLGGDYQITAIQLFNRTDCCSERLNQIQILVGSDLQAMAIFGGGSGGYYYNRQNPVTFKDNKTGRFVRVLLQGSNAILSLAEVKVFGTPAPEPVAVVPEPTPEPVPEPQPTPVVAPPEPCPAPSAPRFGHVWDTATCSWVRTQPPNPDPVPAPGPVIAPPTTAPFIRMPHDNMIFNVMPRKVSFQWDAVGGTEAYAMEIEVLVSGEWRLWEAPQIRGLSAERTFEGDGSYRWHVAGTGSGGSPGQYSPWHSFRINTLGPPAPTLRAPADGADWNCNGITGNCGHPTFLWNATDRAQRYIVTVDVFENGSWRNFITQATTGLQLEVNNFPTGVPARWSVQAIGENDVGGGTSFVRTFQVHWKPF